MASTRRSLGRMICTLVTEIGHSEVRRDFWWIILSSAPLLSLIFTLLIVDNPKTDHLVHGALEVSPCVADNLQLTVPSNAPTLPEHCITGTSALSKQHLQHPKND